MMFRRRRSLLAVPLLMAMILAAGCSQTQAPALSTSTAIVLPSPTATAGFSAATVNATTSTPTGAASGTESVPVTAGTTQASGAATTPAPLPPPDTLLKAGNSCTLINSNDLAHLFPPHNEITRNAPKTDLVTHPSFSQAHAVGTETTCVFYDFHQPGVQTGWMLQFTYLIDTPDASAVQTWSKAWETAKTRADQPVSGLGDDAFTSGPNLFIKKGDTYYAFESTDTHVDEKTSAGVQQLLAYEKQLAQIAFNK